MLTVETRSHPGKVREINEDAVLWDPGLALIAVADGMGGHSAGEVASNLAMDALRGFLRVSDGNRDFTWPFGVDPRMSLTGNRLCTAVKIANRRIFKESEARPDYVGMGTTLVAAIVDDARLTFASVGDSRIYQWQHGVLTQLSRDDSWLTMLQEEAGRDASELKDHPMRNVLTKVVGARPELDVSAKEHTLEPDMTIVLCTDGLHGALPEGALEAALREQPDLAALAERLIEEALAAGGRDNISVLLARYSR